MNETKSWGRRNAPRIFFPLAVIAALVAFFLLLPEPEAPQPDAWPAQPGNSFVLRGVSVFNGEKLVERRDVLVQDGMIAAMSPKVPVPDGTLEFAADGHTLLPAFLDAHTHNFLDARSDALRFGVGTQIDMFTAHETLAEAREQRESLDRTTLADMWSAGTLVTAPGGHGTQFGVPIPTLERAADADAFVADRLREGSDFIKLVLESGHGWGGQLPTLDSETLTAAIEAAHARDRLAVVHAGSHDEARIAIEAGADGLAHVFGDRIADDDLVALAAERGVFIVPTLVVLEALAGRAPDLAGDPALAPWLTPGQADSLRQRFQGGDRGHIIDNALENTRRFHAAGVPLLAGSDAPNPGTAHGASLHRELELLVEAGLTPGQALAAATRGPAEVFGIPERGRIASGYRADFVLVEGDPVADIRATRAIVAIWKNGYRVERPRVDRTGDRPPPIANADIGLEGWYATTDSIQGGRSAVAFSHSEDAFAFDAEVVAGSVWPWAGAMRTLAGPEMDPVDLTGHSELVLRMRNDGVAQVLFFSGIEARGIPAAWEVEAGDWREVVVPLAEVPGLDPLRVRALAIVAGPRPGSVRVEVASVVLR